MQVTVFLAEGFEEIEALTPVDILRRAGVPVRTCSITFEKTVRGAHGISVEADETLSSLDDAEDVIVLPGGMPGTLHLKACDALCERILKHAKEKKTVAAICAAPTVLSDLGLLREAEATCYPSMRGDLVCRRYKEEDVVVWDHIITSRGPGTAAALGFSLVRLIRGAEAAETVAHAMLFEEGTR